MSELRSVLDQIAGENLEGMSASELDAGIEELVHGTQMIDVLIAKRMAQMAKQGDLITLGHPSTTAYLATKGLSIGRARRHATRAKATEDATSTFEAWADSRISTDQADQLFTMASTVPGEFVEAEAKLIEIVEPISVRDTHRALQYWRQSVDGPDGPSEEWIRDRRGLSMSESIDGMSRVDGWLTPIASMGLRMALSAFTPPPAQDDERSPRQKRHDALEELARYYLDNGDTPTVGGEKPHLNVICDIDALQGVAGGTHETMDGTVLDVETIRMIACDASISRIVLGPNSEILDIGRKTRVWTAAQRRGIVARDRHCTAPGCDRSPRWCDIHHETHWADGGTTRVDQGKLLCRFHHTLEHRRPFLKKHRSKTYG